METTRASFDQPDVTLLLEMLELAPASIGLLKGAELRWAYANRAMVASSGRAKLSDLLGKTVRESLPEVEGQGYFEMLEQAYRTGVPAYATERKIVIGRALGPATRYVNFVCQPIFAASSDRVESVLIHSVDVTGAVNARHALEQSEERFRLAQSASRMGVFEWEPGSDRPTLSEGLLRLFGLPAEDASTEAWLARVHPDDRPAVEEHLQRARSSGEVEFDYRYNHPATGMRWLYNRGRRMQENGHVFGVVIDVTDRRKAEQGARDKQEEFNRLADCMPHLVWLADETGHLYWCNRRWYEYTGLSEEEVAERGWGSVFDPETFPEVLSSWQKATAAGTPFEATFRLRGADRVYRQFLSRAVPLRDADGRITRWLGTNTEVDAEVRIRQELETSRAHMRQAVVDTHRLAAIVESSDDAIVSKDLNGTITSWNRGAERLFGYTAKEIVGRSVLTIIPPELHSEEPAILESLRKGTRIDHYETERLRKDGTRIRVSLTISPLRDAEGRIIGASKIARDITERDRLQRAMVESEKLAATGRMAAAIAHEINNPLEAVTNLAYLVSLDPTLGDEGRKHTQMLLEEIERVSNVAKQSLGFFRDPGTPGEFDVCGLLNSILGLNQTLLQRKKIEVRCQFPKACTVFGSAPEIRQVFANLLRNAIEAVSKGGLIRIRVHTGTNGRQRIVVADNGPGIPAEIALRLFQPFATSKGSTGNGLGLWVSRGIVQRHGGRILFRTCRRPGSSGTVFRVDLPASESAFQKRSLPVSRSTS